MKKILPLMLLTALSLSLLIAKESPEPAFKGWKTAKTQHFNFIYEDASQKAAEKYISFADSAWNKIGNIYSFPQDKTNVYVTGRMNIVNAYTFFAPPEIIMFNTPPMEPTFTFRTDWQELFFTHELIHIANVTFEDRNKLMPKLIGPFAYNLDMMNVNGWALEGLTTVLETELTAGGRGRSPYFELMYKAPTIDNGFISYSDIGKEEEPPRGQSYVMGYLIMRSIADRYGIQALADIERNRALMGSWEESVKHVTGENAADIYKDVRIALAKKYGKERTIPEGITISPRDTGTFYYTPEVILDDGSLITIRTKDSEAAAIVKLNPAAKKGSNIIYDVKSEDEKTHFEETVLFTGSFYDQDSVAADKNENVYVVLYTSNQAAKPGITNEINLYKWNQTDGLKQLTFGRKIFQPAVSRNGTRLVAVEQIGMRLRLVSIDLASGEITPVVDDENLSFIQPALNEDGSELAFLVLDGTRAKVAVKSMDDSIKNNSDNFTKTFTIIANDEETIYDPSYPNWNTTGSLTFCCNYRGRLEVFEVNPSATDYKITPVVADPTAALWACNTERGIYYSSYASTGRVIKMLPSENWGTVPDFDGPSPSGQIICFGSLENDFPEFKPFTRPSPEKDVKHRDEKKIEKMNADFNPVTVIQNEKKYIPGIQPFFYIPFVNFFTNEITGKLNFGIGGIFTGITPKLQLSFGLVEADLFYYPQINNFTGDFTFAVPVNTAVIEGLISRVLTSETEKSIKFKEINSAYTGITVPVVHKNFFNDSFIINFTTGLSGDYIRISNEYCGMTDPMDSTAIACGIGGFEFLYKKTDIYKKSNSFKTALMGLGLYNFTEKNYAFGAEAGFEYVRSADDISYGGKLDGRYMTGTCTNAPVYTSVKYNGKKVDNSYEIIAVPQIFYGVNDFLFQGTVLRGYAETIIKAQPSAYSEISDNSLYFLRDFAAGIEYGIYTDLETLSVGYSWKFNMETTSFDSGNFYINCKINWIRF